MSEQIFYKKVGNNYVEVSYYESEVMDSVTEGAHLIVKQSGSTSRRCDIDPALAPMIAAGIYAVDAITTALMRASELRVPKNKQPLTEEQRLAWEHLARTLGQETMALEWPSYRDSVEAGVASMQAEAEKLLAHASVRSAYDHFLLMCKLTKE